MSNPTSQPIILYFNLPATDLKLVRRLKTYQSSLAADLSIMRDLDNEMELNKNEFMNCIRNLLSDDEDSKIKTLAEYEQLAKSSNARKMFHRPLLDLYLHIIDQWREFYTKYEHEVVTPFLQIHTACENEKQIGTKTKIINHIREMRMMLKPEVDLQKISHQETKRKLIRRDYPVFLGLLSLVPMGVERVADVDIMIDEYTREYKIDFKS